MPFASASSLIFFFDLAILDKSLLAHEYGHWLQYEDEGPFYFYGVIAPASVYYGATGNSRGWTETDASNRGYKFLNQPYWWDPFNFPLK